nr:hypothetical protein CFP56_23947 [Quercus suber]
MASVRPPYTNIMESKRNLGTNLAPCTVLYTCYVIGIVHGESVSGHELSHDETLCNYTIVWPDHGLAKIRNDDSEQSFTGFVHSPPINTPWTLAISRLMFARSSWWFAVRRPSRCRKTYEGWVLIGIIEHAISTLQADGALPSPTMITCHSNHISRPMYPRGVPRVLCGSDKAVHRDAGLSRVTHALQSNDNLIPTAVPCDTCIAMRSRLDRMP